MKRNVLLIVLDTARAKSFHSMGCGANTTPGMDQFAREGMSFTRCISPSPWTTPSHASIFTGKYPSEHGIYGKNMHFDSPRNLAIEFHRAGYKTFGMTANRLVSSLNGFHQGFDVFLDPWTPFKEKPLQDELGVSNVKSSNRSYLDKVLFLLSKEGVNTHFKKWFGVNQNASYSTNRAMRFTKRIFSSVADPKFIFINLMQSHEKYNPPRRCVKKLGYPYKKIKWPNVLGYYANNVEIDKDTWNILNSLYEGDMIYTDEKICALLEWMKKKNHLQNTTVIITSDHGEHIGEHDHFTHYFSIFNELLHVPLIIHHPDYHGAGENNGLVQTHDLFRSILETELGISAICEKEIHQYGPVNIFIEKRKKAIAQLLYPVWIKGVIRQNPDIKEENSDLASRQMAVFDFDEEGLKKICWDSRKGITVYDMENDWHESTPLLLSQNEQKKAENIIHNAAHDTNFSLIEDRDVNFSSEIMKQLSDLGYM